MRIRLQKFLASCGVGSRRRCEELIAAGRVRVNGAVITQLGTTVDPESDRVELDGQILQPEPKVYVALNKPAGYICTNSDPQGRPRAIDLVDLPQRLFTVGRLDIDTEGLLILTNDGEFAQALMHPRHGVVKRYVALVRGVPEDVALARLRSGVVLPDGYVTAPCDARLLWISPDRSEARVVIETLEGRKRQVRLMLAAVGHPVIRLLRVAIGPLMLGNLPSGRWRYLTPEEVSALRKAAR